MSFSPLQRRSYAVALEYPLELVALKTALSAIALALLGVLVVAVVVFP